MAYTRIMRLPLIIFDKLLFLLFAHIYFVVLLLFCIANNPPQGQETYYLFILQILQLFYVWNLENLIFLEHYLLFNLKHLWTIWTKFKCRFSHLSIKMDIFAIFRRFMSFQLAPLHRLIVFSIPCFNKGHLLFFVWRI